jgi:penicillin-insensitive murein endopeptidase
VPADAEPVTPAAVLQLPSSYSTSIGGPSTGQVRGAVALPDKGRGFYHNPNRPYEARFGTVELVQSIMRAAARLDDEMPGSVLVVNDLGLRDGGPIRQHASHQAGRDADILFYSVDSQGQPLPSVGVPIDPKGEGTDFKDLADPSDDQPVALDVARTWRFAAALVEVAADNLQRIFIVEHVRSMLLAEAARVHADPAIVQRFADVTCQPEAPHDDHMHVRLFCTPEDMALGCRDGVPNYPFRVAALSALGLSPLMATLKHTLAAQKARAERTTTPEEARKRAGPMHALVKKFLHQREAWLKRPSPGRQYCR